MSRKVTPTAQQLPPLTAHPGDEAHPISHPVAVVAVMGHRIPIEAGRERGEPREPAERGRGDAFWRCAAGVSRPLIPSHHIEGGTIAMSTTIRTASSRPTISQLLSSSAREILRAKTQIRKTTKSKPIASSLVYSSSSGSWTRPTINANSPWPALAAHPPKMKAK